MKIWILLAIAVILLAWGLRERFEATMSIKAPPYDDTEKLRILDMVNNADKEELIRQAKQQDGTLETDIASAQTAYDTLRNKRNPTSEEREQTTTASNTLEAKKKKLLVKAASIVSPAVATFFTEKFKPATVPITNEDVEKYVRNLQETANKTILERLLKRYFVGQSGIGTSVASGYADKLEEVGQEAGYYVANQPGSTAQPPVPAGGAGGATTPATSSTPAGTTTPGTAGTTGAAAGASGTTGAAGSTAPPGSGGVATTTGTTTGGTSTSAPGPTSGGGGRFGIWGPISGGRGDGDSNGRNGRDSTKTTRYPELLGGMNAGGYRTRIDGIGLTEPSKSWKLSMSGMLPSSASLGSGDLSKYLPWSRTPGDMDKIPDPYRVSRTFTTSSYSSKTEPVPFLADFSAFQR